MVCGALTSLVHHQSLLSAKPAHAQVAFRVLFEILEAQRATDCHHFAFYPEVGKTLAVQNGLATDDAVLFPISFPSRRIFHAHS